MNTLKRMALYAAVVLIYGISATCAKGAVFSRHYVTPDDFSSGISDQVGYSDACGGLSLMKSSYCLPYLWVPSPKENTVSKIDARSGVELAKYQIGPRDSNWAPCAVTTDADGNAYVACGGTKSTGKIIKIIAYSTSAATGHTSCDCNRDGEISSTEMLPWGTDCRVSIAANIGGIGSYPSALAFDDSGYLWVSLWGEHSVVKVNVNSGTVIDTVDMVGRPYTLLAGPKGFLYVICRNTSELYIIDEITGSMIREYDFGIIDPSSMCIDENAILWIGCDDGVIRFDTTDNTWHKLDTYAGVSGVTIDSSGNLWVSMAGNSCIACLDMNNGSSISTVETGGNGSESICTDNDGYIWVLNKDSSTASRIDPRTCKRMMTVNTASGAFSNTSFSACVIKQGICPSGSWTVLVNGGIPNAGWGKLSWNEIDNGGKVKVEVRSSDSPVNIENSVFTTAINGREANIPNGRYLQFRFTLAGGGDSTPVISELLVEGRNLAPDVSNAAPTTAKIEKTDHTYEPVKIIGVTDPEGGPVSIVITSVTQDEPVYGLFPDDKKADAIGVGTDSVKLKAECDPGTKDKPGNGRVYKINFLAIDDHGASTKGQVKVSVPPNGYYKYEAKDDGQKYDSSREPLTMQAKIDSSARS